MEGNIKQQNIHKILAHSHYVQFVLFLFSVFLDMVFKIRIFENFSLTWIGVTILVLGSVLIFWAQHTSLHLQKENITKDSFRRGPYRYIKNPTNFGIFFTILGFGIIANSFFVILFSFISSFIVKFIYLDKEEKILTTKYGTPYVEYRKSVKF